MFSYLCAFSTDTLSCLVFFFFFLQMKDNFAVRTCNAQLCGRGKGGTTETLS